MNPKKKPEVTKTQQKKNLSIYIERYREIELYLTLLSRPLLTAVIPTAAVGSDTLFEKVEAEVKDFIESKLQVLTGMKVLNQSVGLSDTEVSALKLVASKIMTKEPAVTPTATEPEPIKIEVIEQEEVQESVLDTADVVVERVESPIAKRKKKAKPVDPSVVPQNVSLDEPTDTMKRSLPSGVKPMPQADAAYSMALAMQQVQASQQAFDPRQNNISGNTNVNFDDPMFR